MLKVPCRVRFAPSPTGNLHLGSLRTALFNYLLARKKQGIFALRIEDTDQKRFVPGCANEFEKTLDYYGLKLDESPLKSGPFWPYVQSQRIHLYKFYAEMLIESGHAYHCFCSEQRLEILRRNAQREKLNSRYDGRCRKLDTGDVKMRLSNGEMSVIRFKFDPGKVHFHDKIFDENVLNVDEGDFVIMKSDNFPTYHFANVVDDHCMQITHVVRGAEWLPSVSKHIRLYDAFGWQQPIWAHLPLITRDGHKKLSKRDADAFVRFYDRDEGYLPLAVLNFLLRNGSGLRNFDLNHLYTLDEMVDSFDENLITRKDFMMDKNALHNYGCLAFRGADFDNLLLPEILNRLKAHFASQNIELKDESVLEPQYIRRVVEFLHLNEESFCKLSELITGNFRFFFYWPKETIAVNILSKLSRDTAIKWLKLVLSLNYPKEWRSEHLYQLIEQCKADDLITFRKLTSLIRIALIGCSSGPPITELVNFFSLEESRNRLSQTISLLEQHDVMMNQDDKLNNNNGLSHEKLCV